jgi:hypothetical protein
MADELDSMLAKYGSQAQASKSTASIGPSHANDELDQMLSKYSGNPNQGAPSMKEYFGDLVSDDSDEAVKNARDADTSFFHVKSSLADIIPSGKRDLSKLTALASGALQGGAEAGQALANIPNVAIKGINSVANTNIPAIPMPEINASPYEYQQEAKSAHPGYSIAGNVIGESALAAPMFGETMLGAAPSLSRLAGTGAAVGAAGTNSEDPLSRLGGATLGAVGAAAPSLVGKGVQGVMKGISGSTMNPETVNAARDVLGEDADLLPNVLLTKDDQAKKDFINKVMPAAGNDKLRQQATINAEKIDSASNDIINGFNVADKDGLALTNDKGEAPTQSQVKRNVVDKINNAHTQAKDETNQLYSMVDETAKSLGDKSNVDVNSYANKLQEIVNAPEGSYHKEAVNLAKSQLDQLKERGAVSNPEKDSVNKAFGMNKDNKGISFEEATNLDKDINKKIGNNVGNAHEPALHHDLSELKSSLNNDISRSTDRSGSEELHDQWLDAKKSYATKVAPFYENKSLKKFLHKGNVKAESDDVLVDLVKGDKPERLEKTLSLVPDIKDDLGFLKLRSTGDKMGKKNNPDIQNALESIRAMSDDQGVTLFGPDKWSKLNSLKTLHGGLRDYLDIGKNPNTGGRVQNAMASSLTDALSNSIATGAAFAGNAPLAIGSLAAKAGGKLVGNKIKGNVSTSAKQFANANANSLLSPAAQKAYRSTLAGAANTGSTAMTKKDKK